MEWVKELKFVELANALVILITGLAVTFGIRSGRAQPAAATTDAPHVELAGALVDSSSVKMLAGEIAGQAVALTGQTAAMKDGIEVIEDLTRAVVDLKEQVQELRHEMGRKG